MKNTVFVFKDFEIHSVKLRSVIMIIQNILIIMGVFVYLMLAIQFG